MKTETCPKCGGTMDMHYTLWCPMCDKPEIQTLKSVDFFKSARYIAAQENYEQPNFPRRGWVHELLLFLEANNDTYIPIYIPEEDEDDEYDEYDVIFLEYCEGLMKYFGFNRGDEVVVWVSW